MVNGTSIHLAESQRNRLKLFSAEQCVDIHCHCLPGLDDGPATMEDSLALCRALVADGITTVIATPHELGSFEGQNLASEVRQAVEVLQLELAAQAIPLNVLPGADVRVDDQLLSLLSADKVLTLADSGAYLLLELPHDTMVDLKPVIRALADQDITSIISHPERQSGICRHPEIVLPWLAGGALLQITAGSLMGDFGALAEKTAWHFMSAGLASLVASDAHDTVRRPPSMTRAIQVISEKMGHIMARRLCIENPLKVYQGTAIRGARLAAPMGARI